MTTKSKESKFETSLTSRVSEAQSRDTGRGLARLDPEMLEALGARVGDVLEIRGKRSTACRAMPSLTDQRGSRTIQIDGVTRLNAGTSIGEKVELRLLAIPPARSLELTANDGAENSIPGQLLEGLALNVGDQIRLPMFGARVRELTVSQTQPKGPVLVAGGTRIRVVGGGAGEPAKRGRGVSYEDVGGLTREIRRVREMVELPLRHPRLFERLGIEPPKGVLLCGPPGTGKTLIARAVAAETQAAFFSVSGPEVIHKFYGESEARLREIFESAGKASPAIIFLDEIDSLAPKRDRVQGDVEKRVVAQLLALMDGLKDRGQIVVIGATNLPDLLDPALRRPGRFDRELTIGVPDAAGRREILDIHTRGMPLAADVCLDELARRTPGFVGADLAALCREAAMATLRKLMPEMELDLGIPEEKLVDLSVDREAFQTALSEVSPSATRELVVEVPKVSWQQVGGLTEAKARLREAIEWPIAHAALFRRVGCRPPKGLLLVGPPGSGKTLLARASATACACNFLSVKGPELLSMYVGDSERAVREFFRKARQSSPCLVFLDEVDSFAPARFGASSDSGVSSRVVAQLLTEMDGIEDLDGVLVLAATNRLDLVDQALLRPGRFDVVVHLESPDAAGREEILHIHTAARPLARDVDLPGLARIAAGLTPADLAGACERAGLAAVREALGTSKKKIEVESLLITQRHLESGLAEVRKSSERGSQAGARRDAVGQSSPRRDLGGPS